MKANFGIGNWEFDPDKPTVDELVIRGMEVLESGILDARLTILNVIPEGSLQLPVRY